jgi:ABC-type transport system substrate-binding protein/tetratricopeptide (TPR) repeat protein
MIGTRLADRYEVVGELGRGGMGVVYRAKDPVLSRDVAIKLIPPGNLTANAEERFLREAQIVAQMDHPAIVPIYDLGRHEGALFFVMPVLPGTNLRHLLRDGSLRLGDVLDIGTQVAEALDYSHARGIVHRDIKPENVMTAREEGGHVRARVMDFGLALATTEDRLTKTGTLVGTVSYFSPEQVTSRSFDGRTDVYALGTVLYECLAGEPPFSGEVQTILYRIVHELPQSLRALGADVSEELEAAIFQCLEKDPEKRPRKAGHLAEALRRYRSKLHEEEYTRSVMLTASRMVGRPTAAAPFIGREKEMAELQKRLHAAVSGECQFAVIAGEPGIGKTRLIEQLTSLARARRIRVLQGRFVEQDRAFAHQGFCELIQDYFRSKDAGTSEASRPDFSDLAGDLIALFPVLSEIAELRAAAGSDAGAGRAAKAEDKTAVFELIARTLTRLAHGKPLVLVLEELHGAEQSIEALQYIVRRLAPTPTLIVGSYRTTEIEKRHPLVKMLDSFAGDPRFASVALGPFSASENRSLVELAAGGGKLSDELADRLYDATKGNPFFTRELVRALLDSGGLAKDDTGALSLSGAAALSTEALPQTIQEAIGKRLARLPDPLRELLSVASVLGKSFEFRDLETLVESDKDVEESVERLVGEGLLVEERVSRSDTLGFSSGMVRDVLYGALSRRRRRSLHRKVADLLEKRYAGRLDRVYPELVHHFSEADVPEKTVEYGLKLAQKSVESFSSEDAIRAATATLEYLEDEEWEGDRSLEGDARLLLAQAHRLAGDVDETLAEAEKAVTVFEREGQAERALAAAVLAAETCWQARRVDEARRWVDRGVEITQASAGSPALTRLLSLGATVANMRGEYQRASAFLAEIERRAPKEKAAEEALPGGGTLVVALANPVGFVEPALAQTTEETEVLANVFETLVATDPLGNLAPLLCESWSVADDGRTVRLNLRSGIRFSDGAPLDASAVKSAFERSIRLVKESPPPVFTAIRGAADLLSGAADAVAGIETPSPSSLTIRLGEPLPIFPALLTATVASIARDAGGTPLGTGPFRIASRARERVVLERNPHALRPPLLDAVEFRTSSASAIASGLREGRVDVGRDLAPQDLEELLKDPTLRAGFVETPKKGTYFAIFNTHHSALGGNPVVRRALAGVTRSQDFVWASLGRIAVPATGLIPPGILGNDPGRRRARISREEAARTLREAGLAPPIRLKAAIHPILQDRFRALTSALLSIWGELGVEVVSAAATMAEFLDPERRREVDVWIGRWIADYDDPDNFTSHFFHSRSGNWRDLFSSPDFDRRFEEARVESRPAAREALYRKIEQDLLDEAVFIPLFHEIDYRIAVPSVRHLTLQSQPPFVNYAEIAKAEAAPAPAAPRLAAGGGVITVPIAGVVSTLDPALMNTIEEAETISSIFEGLTRSAEGRTEPWLAASFEAENEGRRYRFKLRRGVRFHDGRPLTARDVRFSFERILQDEKSDARGSLAPIRGAAALMRREAAELAGFRILSPGEFTIELEKPISFFPVLLSTATLAILPEGSGRPAGTWREGCVGTGPFRVVRFEPGKQLTLEKNPLYWREGIPRSDGLVFRFGVSSEEIKSEFLAGRFSLASDLLPADAEALRHDPRFASGYKESPRLSTYYLALNWHAPELKDQSVRRRIFDAVDAPSLVRRTLGRLAIPAGGLIPPGLLGHTARPEGERKAGAAAHGLPPLELAAAIHPVYLGEYAAFGTELVRSLREAGVVLRSVGKATSELLDLIRKGEVAVAIARWTGQFPDSDTFVHGLLSSEGLIGRLCNTPEIERLVERGREELDPALRDAIYREVEEILARDALLLPLFHEQVYRFARPEVEGLVVGFSAPTVRYENLRVRGKR